MTPILHRQPRTSATLILAGAVLYFVLGVFIMGARNAPQADRYENVITAIQPMPASTLAMEVMEGEEDESTNQHHTSVSLRSYPVLISTDVEDLPIPSAQCFHFPATRREHCLPCINAC